MFCVKLVVLVVLITCQKKTLQVNLQHGYDNVKNLNISGPPPDVELPQKPFGLVDISQQEKNVSFFKLESSLKVIFLILSSLFLTSLRR